MGEPVDVTKLEPGTVLLNKYRVVETLGIGGMGVVVAAEHLMLDTRVALKFLLPKLLSNESVAERFMREARAAIRIDSVHVCKVIDVDTLPDGPPFMVMEYLQGEDLAFLIDSGRRFSIEEAVDLIVQAAEALAQAHQVGIVHRDVKPANLFVVDRGAEPPIVKVLDFGISKVMDDGDFAQQAALTKTTAVLGSGLYMSPEQMRSAKKVDRRTDIYALGVCLYELLTHTLPYTADSFAELCVKVSTEPPEPLRQHRADVSEPLATIIARAYATNPDDRYQSIAEFVAALAPYGTAASQQTIAAIGLLDDRRTSASLPPPAPGAAPSSGAAARPVPAATTAASAALARTAGTGSGTRRSRVVFIAAGAVVLLAAAGAVFAVGWLDGGLRPIPGEGATTSTAAAAATASGSAASAAPATASTAAATASEATPPADGGADAAAKASAGPSAVPTTSPPAAAPPRPRPQRSPRPAPDIIREGDFCFRINPETRLREPVSCE